MGRDLTPGPLHQLEQGPIFVVGAGRSGTTWVLDILSAHDAVAGVFESGVFMLGVLRTFAMAPPEPRIADRSPGLRQLVDAETALADIRTMVGGWLARALGPEDRFLVEKTPIHHESLALIAAVFPDARIVNVLRDGRDVVVSALAADETWRAAPGRGEARSLRVLRHARRWAQAVRNVASARETLAIPVIDVRYERLSADAEGETRRLLAACEIPCDSAQLQAIVAATTFDALPRTGDGQFARGGRVGDWRTGLRGADRVLVEAGAGHVLKELGYGSAVRTPLGRVLAGALVRLAARAGRPIR